MMYRSKRILDLARDIPCQVCGSTGTTVAAHANWMAFGKGKGLKAHDWAVAYLCHGDHDTVDGRAGGLIKQEQQDLWAEGWKNTVILWGNWARERKPRGLVALAAIHEIPPALFIGWTGMPLDEATGALPIPAK